MPRITWQELSDLKHVLWEAEIKLAKDGLNREAKYIKGVIEILNEIVLDHEEEDK